MIEKQMNIAELQAPILANQMLPALPLSETYMMDCVEGMKQYPDKWFDLAVVDPPYGIERFQKNVECKGRKRFKNKINDWDKKPDQKYFNELLRVSKHQIIWGANHFWAVSQLFSLPNCPHFIFWDKI